MAIKVINGKDLCQDNHINMIVYGAPGSGKTTFCSTAPKPLLINLEGENATISLIGMEHIDVVEASNTTEIGEAIAHAINNKYETVCIDSLSRLCEILIDKIKGDDPKKPKTPEFQHWRELVEKIKELTWNLQSKKINAIFVCLEKDTEFDGINRKGIAVPGGLAQSLPGIVDVVGYLSITQDGKRRLCINPVAGYYAKHRRPLHLGSLKNLDEINFKTLQTKLFSKEQ